jgi:hypothetical protein
LITARVKLPEPHPLYLDPDGDGIEVWDSWVPRTLYLTPHGGCIEDLGEDSGPERYRELEHAELMSIAAAAASLVSQSAKCESPGDYFLPWPESRHLPRPERRYGLGSPEIPAAPSPSGEPAAAPPPSPVADGMDVSDADDRPPLKPASEQLDENSIADSLAALGYHLEAVFVRHFKGRQSTHWQDLIKEVAPDEKGRDWATVKTWANRVNNALLDLEPPCRMTFHTSSRDYRVIKRIEPE